MPTDTFGGPDTFETARARAAWSDLTHAFLAHSCDLPESLKRMCAAAPDHPLVHAARGYFMLLLSRRELVADARAAYAAALRALEEGGGTRRERLYVRGLGEWLAGWPTRAADAIDEALAADPADAFALKLSHATRFQLGDIAGMRRSVEQALPAYGTDHPAAGYARGCHAFTLEESGEYEAAERTGRQALELSPDDAWGLHAVAHVCDMTGRSDTGCAWLAPRRATFSGCNNFRYHVWWHYALFELDLGNIDRVLRIYDERIRADRTDDYRDIANGASLLARLTLEGVDVGSRWAELAALAEPRVDDSCLVFADLHYLLALTGDRRMRAADAMRGRLAATEGEDDYARTVRLAGAPAAEGIVAFSLGRHDSAFRALAAARPALQAIGGSHAQRDVFERLTIEAAIRARRPDDARRLILERARKRGALDRFGRERLSRLDGIPPEAPTVPLAVGAGG